MKQQKMLYVEWNDKESATYYIDKDKHSKASQETANEVSLVTYSGVYTFNESCGSVKLFANSMIMNIEVKRWKTFYTPVP